MGEKILVEDEEFRDESLLDFDDEEDSKPEGERDS